MLWDIQARMKPALGIIDLIPNIHRTPALTALRRAVLEGRPATVSLSADERELAFYDAPVQLTSPIGARVLMALYQGGHLKLKKPGVKPLRALETYIASEAAFRADVARILADDDAKRLRLAQIIADPGCALPEDLSAQLIDKVMTARLGRGTFGELQIAGLTCYRALSHSAAAENDRFRAEGKVLCWWLDGAGNRQGDPDPDEKASWPNAPRGLL
ncbi:MAG: hypothetical protein Q7J57_04475 [Gemmobacter sp.]|nr:hypothetical protein [Gemmobacter sp.]